jgi:hypothetical protein
MQGVFEKYGQYIRHLRISFLVTIDAAFVSTHCIHLRSLDVLSSRNWTKAESWESSRLQMLKEEGGGLSWSQKQQPAETGPFLAPEFEGAIVPAPIFFRIKSVQRTDWMTFQHFWLLVKRNRSLTTLKIGQALLTLCRIKLPIVFLDLLAALPSLGTMDYSLCSLNDHHLLERLEHLHSFSSRFYSSSEALDHRKTYNNIRSFTKHDHLSQRQVAWIVKDFPNIECLTLGWIGLNRQSYPEAQRILGESPLKLKKLCVTSVNHCWEGNIWAKIISLSPELRRFVGNNLVREVIDALIQHSSKLLELRQTHDNIPIDGQEMGRFMNGILESCPDLRILDCINCTVNVPLWEDKAWVCSDLETFRCRVVGFDRLGIEEERVLKAVAERSQGHQELFSVAGKRRLIGKELRCLEQHNRIYDRLSTLTSLKVIDLGGGYRDEMLLLSDDAPFYEVDGYEYVRYRGPMENSMELSLSSGLGRLAKLKGIEVFGFEGVDHRIGEAKLDWMATTWPRLRELRGLHVDIMPHVEFDLRRAELRKYMRALRPEVKHLGTWCRTDDGTMDDPPVLGPRTVRPWATVAPTLPAVQVAPRQQFRKALCCVVQ